MNDTDKETIRRVYQAQYDDYKAALTTAEADEREAKTALDGARNVHASALYEVARLDGRIAALHDLAAKEGIELD